MKSKYAVAIHNFDADAELRANAQQSKLPCRLLNLCIGDQLLVYSESSDWAYGAHVDSKRDVGIFPLSMVTFVKRTSRVDTHAEYANFINEMETTLDLWQLRIKEVLPKQTHVHYLKEIIGYMNDILAVRQKIIGMTPEKQMLNILRNQVARKIDRGNMLLGYGVVVRRENGVPYEPETIVQMYNEHVASQKRTVAPMVDEDVLPDVFSIMFQLESIQLSIKYNCEITMQLYDRESKCFMSDTYTCIWKPSDTNSTFSVLFVNISKEELTKEVFLVVRVAQIAPIIMTSGTMKKGHDVGPPATYCRQVFAYDFFNLKDLFVSLRQELKPTTLNFYREENQSFEVALKSMVQTGRAPYNSVNTGCQMQIHPSIIDGSLSEIQHTRPEFFNRGKVAVVPRISYPDTVSFPALFYDEPARNDLYLTLLCAELFGKSVDRNIEARMHVVDSNGTILQNCFETISSYGSRFSSDYRSFVYLQNDRPVWREQVKLLLPFDASVNLHLRITFHSRKPYDKGRPEKGPFAMAFCSILHDTNVVLDGEHELLVYKVEPSQFDDANVAYLSLAQTKRALRELGSSSSKMATCNGFTMSDKSSVSINTQLYSKVFTHNAHVQTVLRWRQNNNTDLQQALVELAKPIGVWENDKEIVKFMEYLLDSLFELWDDQERDHLELPVFDVVVKILRLSDDQRNTACVSPLMQYLSRMPYGTAAIKLMRCFNHYLTSGVSTNNEKTRDTMRVMGRLFQFILQSKKSEESFAADGDPATFKTMFIGNLEAVLDSLRKLMSEQRDRMAIQNVAVKNLMQIIDPFYNSGTYHPLKLSEFVVNIMRSFGSNVIWRERLHFVKDLIDTQIFMFTPCRVQLHTESVRVVVQHLSHPFTENREFPDIVAECSEVVAPMLDKLYTSSGQSVCTEDEFAFILTSIYRPFVHAMIQIQNHDCLTEVLRAKIYAVILALLHKMSAQVFNNYLSSRADENDQMNFVMEMVQMIRDLIQKCPYQDTWQQMVLQQNRILHKSLRFVMSALQNYFSFADNATTESTVLWQEYMMTMVKFVTQPSLESTEVWLVDPVTDARFQIRSAAAKDLRSMWFRLTPTHKMRFATNLVSQFLRVALLDDDETRLATMPIFFDMMQMEFHSNQHSVHQKSFKRFSDEFIKEIDSMVEHDRGTRAFQTEFKTILTQQCQSDLELWQGGGRDWIGRVNQLLSLLFEYREQYEIAAAERGMMITTQLMKYYKEHGHDDLYLVYVMKLYDLHEAHRNEIEAAKTLLLFADSLQWSDATLSDFLISKNLNRNCGTELELKDKLLNEAAMLLTKGELWEDAIKIYEDLFGIYKKRNVDYEKIATTLECTAKLYRKIDNANRAHFLFYLVAFYGQDFPTYLNGTKFVFRSNVLERRDEFIARMTDLYGNPTTITSMDDMSNLTESSGRHMQVIPLDPIGEAIPFDDANINPAIKDYYRNYNIRNFEYSRVVDRKETKWTAIAETDVMRQWIAKRRLVTYEPLPHILRFSQVISETAPIMISPLKRAVEQMKSKNADLLDTAQIVLRNREYPAKKLSADIVGVVQANVMGGIKNYEPFFIEKGDMYEAEEKDMLMNLGALIVEQVEILEFCLYVHAQRPEIDRGFHDHLIDSFIDHKRVVADKFGKIGTRLAPGQSIYQTPILQLAATELGCSTDDVHKRPSTSTLHLADAETMNNGAPSPSATMTIKSRSGILSKLASGKKSVGSLAAAVTSPNVSFGSLGRSVSTESNKLFASMRKPNSESLGFLSMSSPKRTTRISGENSEEVVRFRQHESKHQHLSTASSTTSAVAATPPPLPPRPANLTLASFGSSHDSAKSSFDRNLLIGDKPNKAPIPTPIVD